MIITLPWPDAKLSPNDHDNRIGKLREIKAARELACYMTINQIEAIDYRGTLPPKSVQVIIKYYPPDNRRADWDNVVGRCKAYQDGIFAALGWDDKLITTASVYKCPPVKGGQIEYSIFWES